MDPTTIATRSDRGNQRQQRIGALERTTGRDRSEWFAVLDDWGAAGRPYREIADWLTGVHGISNWWAQKLIVEYEQERGVRAPGIRAGGTFEIGASKAINVAVPSASDAFLDAAQRERWLSTPETSVVASGPAWLVRAEADDGSRLQVDFRAQGSQKTLVVLNHLRLPDADTAARAKAQWRKRLTDLKATLEG
jgi:hypothetical protein